MRIAFVSNYINHHQIPFCNAMNELLKGEFTFVQTEPMEEERVWMGWHAAERPEYVRCFYEEEAFCRRLILDCDVFLYLRAVPAWLATLWRISMWGLNGINCMGNFL